MNKHELWFNGSNGTGAAVSSTACVLDDGSIVQNTNTLDDGLITVSRVLSNIQEQVIELSGISHLIHKAVMGPEFEIHKNDEKDGRPDCLLTRATIISSNLTILKERLERIQQLL